eukprot:CAMPEP_0184725952 /NCGR_PEP_ID=MMETSP0314-20130426/32336_1 /TAXON_ID=38298 /ORGANISM="Rhodella maculata, Strain CCMP 736" /LENGTH=58 /DNA_ID=CAMNT_0027191287 /DNA_START=501 /DNA_END=674 /DNA_ORIENTATION=+
MPSGDDVSSSPPLARARAARATRGSPPFAATPTALRTDRPGPTASSPLPPAAPPGCTA